MKRLTSHEEEQETLNLKEIEIAELPRHGEGKLHYG